MTSIESSAQRLFTAGFMVLSLGLASCESTTHEGSYPPLRYTDYPSIELDVALIEIENAYAPSGAPPHVDHLFPTSPLEATNQWVKDRLKAVGTRGRVRAVVANAAVVAESIQTNKTISGYFTNEQATRYSANLEVVVEVLDDRDERVGVAWASATRTQTLAEDASLEDRDLIWYRMANALMIDFDKEMERQIRGQLDRWVR